MGLSIVVVIVAGEVVVVSNSRSSNRHVAAVIFVAATTPNCNHEQTLKVHYLARLNPIAGMLPYT